MVKPEALHQLVDLHQNLVEFAPRPLSPFQFSFNSRLMFQYFCDEHTIISSDVIFIMAIVIITIIIIIVTIYVVITITKINITRCEAYQAMVHSTASEDQKAELFDSLADEGFQVFVISPVMLIIIEVILIIIPVILLGINLG